MKKWFYIALFIAAPFFCFAEEKAPAEKITLESIDVDKVSQTLGHLIVRHLDNPGFKFNVVKIIEGMQAESEGKASPMSEEEYEQTVSMIQENIFLQLSEKNLSAAASFLEKNAQEKDIISINPKLQYKVLQAGESSSEPNTVVSAESVPLVHYTGKLLDGTVFSSSKDSNHPISLPIKQTIPGFTEGLIGMKKGEKRVLYIHPELAYGVSGHLPPNSLLIFEVEILEIDTKPAVAQIEENKVVEEPVLNPSLTQAESD